MKLRIASMLLIALFLLPFVPAEAADGDAEPYVIESYYRVKWGYFDEFKELFKKNHYPILMKLKELGHIDSVVASTPINHAGEDSRWDWRITITLHDRRELTAFENAFGAATVELYPDTEKLKREEQRRFSLLLEHTDVPITLDDLSGW